MARKIAPSVFSLVDKTTKEHWRQVADSSKLHVYYATGPGLLAGNKPLRDLAATGPEGIKMVNDYSNYLIGFLRGQGYPDFNTQNLLKNRNRELGVYDWSDPTDKTGVAIVATQTGAGSGFAKIKDIANTAHRSASAAMKVDYPGGWNDFEVDPGHLVRNDQPGITPALLRAEESKRIIEPRSFARIHRTENSGATTKARILAEIDKDISSVKTAHTENSVKYSRDFNPSGIMRGSVKVVVLVQHDKDTNQKLLNKFEKNLGKTVSNRMKGVKVSRLEGSNTFIQDITKYLANTFRGIKNIPLKWSKTVNDKRKKISSARKVTKTDVSNSIKLKIPKVKKQVDTGASLFNLRNLINGVLAERVKQEMDSSSAPPINLRYQTGRFSSSAALLTLTRNRAGILAGTYTYQRAPYDVFLPGHPLDNGRRDPQLYIEGAIRKTAMSLLKTKFKGVQLELT
jgi:hypothetical protein